MIFYGLLAAKQQNSAFDCEKIQVQFGDGFSEYIDDLSPIVRFHMCTRSHCFLSLVTMLPVFSGFYEIAKADPRRDRRPVYWDSDRRAAFRYCVNGDNGLFSFASNGYWVFNYISEDVTRIEDMCENYISRAQQRKLHTIVR